MSPDVVEAMEQKQPALPLVSFADIARGGLVGSSEAHGRCLGALAQWTRSFLMSPHPELGRTGDVCPFTAQSARMDTLRFGASLATGDALAQIRREMFEAFEAFEDIPHSQRMGHFRAVIVGFPNCADPKGLAALSIVQKDLRLKSLRRDRMVGLLHDRNDTQGLWNAGFRPLRSPIPLIAVRALVENDAAFAIQNPIMVPSYLKRFGWAGGRKLAAHLLRRA